MERNSLAANLANYTIDSISQFTQAVRGFIGIRIGGVYSVGNEYRLLNLMNNPTKMRYAGSEATSTAVDSEFIGERYSVETRLLPNKDFLDSVGGLTGYTHDEGYLETNNSSVIGNMSSVLKNNKRIEKVEKDKYIGGKYLGNTFDNFDPKIKLDKDNLYNVDDKNTFSNGLSVDNKNFSPDNQGLVEPIKTNSGTKGLWSKGYVLYDEDGKLNIGSGKETDNQFIGHNINRIDEIGLGNDTMLYKTNKLFREGKINSMINRFHIGQEETSEIESAIDKKAGISRGRNLLKKNETEHNGYDNPYCRVWTSHYQYSKFKNLIRHEGFQNSSKLLGENILRPHNGNERLHRFSSLMDNGMVQIAPYRDGMVSGDDAKEIIKKCMFSIENLAWKDIKKDARVDGYSEKDGLTLSKEQEGPNGGRIMWFPPYNLKVNENVSVNWNSNNFIGRGEPIYTYTNTERTGTLSFTVLVDHPSVLDNWAYKHKGTNDATAENEQRLLRFFAGCDDPDEDDAVKEKPLAKTKVKIAGNTTRNAETDLTTTSKPNKENPAKILRFFVFFPNDLSGVDYLKDPNVVVDYLLYGNTTLSGVSGETCGYEMNGNGVKDSGINGCICGDTITYKLENGKILTWHYEADKDKRSEILLPGNYEDTRDYGLNNSNNFKEWLEQQFVKSTLGLDDDTSNVYTLQDLVTKDLLNLKTYGASEEDYFIENITDDEYEIYAYTKGYASSHGYLRKNAGVDGLSVRRAKFLKSYLQTLKFTDDDKIQVVESGVIEVPKGNRDVSSIEAKLGRCAEVIISLVKKHKEPNLNISENGNSASQENREQNKSEINKNQNEQSTVQEIEVESQEKYGFYDDEYLYFQKINDTDDIVKRNLVEKVQFFDPAFHSITPEGFNARLTFLHQCTRQGPTMSASDMAGEAPLGAGNLAFGRMPVCVLRIGDFYNTKILIDSLSIDYLNGDGIQWDLNPEGIGIQPTMANVTLGIKFLGGSDISGPIARLQDAVSYNFFANTSVYDRRADYRDTYITEDNDASMAWNPIFVNGSKRYYNIAGHEPFSTINKGEVNNNNNQSQSN